MHEMHETQVPIIKKNEIKCHQGTTIQTYFMFSIIMSKNYALKVIFSSHLQTDSLLYVCMYITEINLDKS